MLSDARLPPALTSPIYTPGAREVLCECLVQEQNTMFPARARIPDRSISFLLRIKILKMDVLPNEEIF